MQAIRGPVLLITLGVLFELQQSGGLPFWKTWPFLLIAIGVMKLIEWAAGGPMTPATGPQQPYAPQQTSTGQSWMGQPGYPASAYPSWRGRQAPMGTAPARPMPGAQTTAQTTPPPPLPPQAGGPQL